MLDRFKKQADERHVHQAKLEAKHGLSGHPKADKLYALAWDMGHSAGYHEVEIYYADMADLLTDHVPYSSTDYESLRHSVLRLRTEVNCRIEHGAESGGHLEYVQDRLDSILDATK